MSSGLTSILVGGIVAMFVSPFILLIAWLPMRRKAAGEEVSHQERLAILRNTAIAVVAVAVIVAAGFMLLRKDASPASTSSGVPAGMGIMGASSGGNVQVAELPSKLAGIPLAGTVTGSQALQQIATMHPSQIPVTDAIVGSYQDQQTRIDVWAAYTPAAQMAPVMAQQMAAAIGGGQTPFTTPEKVGGGVWRMEGMGQVHYFFSSGNAVWWISADKSVAEKALAQTKALAAAG